MKKRLLYAFGLLLLLVLSTLVLWQGSLDFGSYGPENPTQVYLFWAVSTLVFLLTVTLGFMLVRAGVKLYVERRQGAEGSRIRTKLVLGALALSILPALFLVVFDVEVLNRSLTKWFTRPAFEVKENLIKIAVSLRAESQRKVDAQARWLAMRAKVENFKFANCADLGVDRVWIKAAAGNFELCPGPAASETTVVGMAALDDGRSLVVEDRMAIDLAAKEQEIQKSLTAYEELNRGKEDFRSFYVAMLSLITLFLLFVATWTGLFMARQISVPISALLKGAGEVRSGNLSYRVSTKAIDELATLVRAFNEMTQALEANERELERRRRFAEAILESVPAGVVSVSTDGRILRTNHALAQIFPERQLDGAIQLSDLFAREDAGEIRYLMNRARRTGLASRQLEMRGTAPDALRHLSVTVTALEGKGDAGFVLVIEDTSELLRAQKSAAWSEVARRIAHELKNPLTPIALSAERVRRLVDRKASGPDAERVFRECADTIAREVETVRTLVDEFSQFARFPAAQLRPAHLNDVVESGLAVFHGRLDGIQVERDLAVDLPAVSLDPEQVKRVVVNLVDNAAEAMHDQPLRRLYISTQSPSPDIVELVVADTGCGIAAADREKLFLPYFSTKERGTGLGLAIVNHVLGDHQATIRVEDNRPTGARFVVEFPALAPAEVAGV